jgi:anthranilate synthase component 1
MQSQERNTAAATFMKRLSTRTFHPTLDEFREQTKQGSLIPVWTEVLADTETPVSAFYKIGHGREYGFLLESVEGGEHLARYSFLGTDPRLIFRSRGNEGAIYEDGKVTNIDLKPGVRDPLHVLKEILGRYKYVPSPDLPQFVGGAVGLIGYDTVRFFENLPMTNPADESATDDCLFLVTDALIVFDHVKHRVLALCNARIEDGGSVDEAYYAAVEKAEELVDKLLHGTGRPRPRVNTAITPMMPEEFVSNMTQDEYEAGVLKAKEYIMAGDSFQIQVARRLSKRLLADPFDVYRALRSINPSPYMFYLVFGDVRLIGASPEILVSAVDKTVTIRPLAGTRPRSGDAKEDARRAESLLSDEKERAEHVMLVDLGRNDIGRVAKFGTVRVEELMTIEWYSHVMHIVSDVKGEMRDDVDEFEVLRASFPAGTLTGAPKVRTMEIIDEIESSRRGFYGGGIGYFSFSGNMDTCITIRTAMVKGDTIYLQAAGGVVADSDPSYEYRETAAKMRALVNAVEWAERGLE